MMRILALEPYYGGSHKAFLDGWCSHSRHEWTLLTLPATKWKWRMRHAAVTFAQQLAGDEYAGKSWDVLFCSDMLNLAEFLGLSPAAVRLPAVAYFHENQLTYPARHEDLRDLHFGITNMTTALAAEQVWFNSAFHREGFLDALTETLGKMPDNELPGTVEAIRSKSQVHPPGIEQSAPRGPRRPGPMRICWAARWEHDKGPGDFFEAVRTMARRGIDFRLSVIGQQFRQAPQVFAEAREEFSDRIDHWGYQPDRESYRSVLQAADVYVSTARHEFFGISAAEAIEAGAYPVLPKRLAYPELLQLSSDPSREEFFYEDGPDELAGRLALLAGRLAGGGLWPRSADGLVGCVSRFYWDKLAGELDDAMESVLRGGS